MKLSKPVKLMLFALGKYYQKASKRVIPGFDVAIPKTDFIRLVKNSGIVAKTPRAIYRNLEILEKKRLITYQNRELFIAVRGFQMIKAIDREILPYQSIAEVIEKNKVIAITKKPQMIFK